MLGYSGLLPPSLVELRRTSRIARNDAEGDASISELRIRIDQSTFGDQRCDLALREASLAQNLAAMLPKPRRMLPDRWRGLAPGRSGAGDAQRAFGRVLHG